MHADFKIVSDLLTLDIIKASEFVFDGGAIISKITQIEKEYKIEFEHIHVSTTNDNDESGCSYEKKLTLECDNGEKEVRLKRNNDLINDNVQFRRNISLKHKDRC